MKECNFESVVGQVYTEEDAKRFIGEMGGYQAASLLEQSGRWSCTSEASFLCREDHERLCPVNRSRLPTTDCSAIFGSRSSDPRSHASVHERRSWCGRSRGKSRKRAARKLQDLGKCSRERLGESYCRLCIPELQGGDHGRSSRQAKVQICQTCAVLGHPSPGARGGTRLVTTVSVSSETIWSRAWSLLPYGLPRHRDIAVPVYVPWRQGAWAR